MARSRRNSAMFVGRCFASFPTGVAQRRDLRCGPSDFSNSEVPTLPTNQNQRKSAKGAPGLAFETWDPRNPYLMDTRDVTHSHRKPYTSDKASPLSSRQERSGPAKAGLRQGGLYLGHCSLELAARGVDISASRAAQESRDPSCDDSFLKGFYLVC